MSDDPLDHLRTYRFLHRRRDELIREAARRGATRAQIARAAGISESTVKRALRRSSTGGQNDPPRS